MNDDCRIEEFEEKPIVSSYNTISTGIYVIRRRQLIELIERAAQEGRHDFVNDILIRYKNLKRIYGYKIRVLLEQYFYGRSILSIPIWHFCSRRSVIISSDRNRRIKTKIDDLPPAKYNPGAEVKNSLVASGCIINGTVENSVLFKECICRQQLCDTGIL